MAAITKSVSSEDDELQIALNTNNVVKSKLLHGYEILRVLGKGNYGSVVLASRPLDAHATNSDRYERNGDLDKNLCVIKSVKHTRKRDGANVDAIKEVHVLKDLKHPCIVEYIDSFFNENETRLFIAMSYCDSGNLSDRIKDAIEKQQWIDEDQIIGWFAQLSLALAFIHEKKPKILHRDIKPENVFLTYNGTCVKLGDFGFTRTLANTMELALTRCGTPYYLSPEHCMNKAYNAKADVWAAGIVLYELLTLQVPFKGKTILELRSNILRAPLKRPAAHYSKEVCGLLLQMLSREPEKRPNMRDVVRKPLLQTFLRTFLSKHGYNNTDNNLIKNTNRHRNSNASINKKIVVPEKGPFLPQRPPKGPSPTKPKRSVSAPPPSSQSVKRKDSTSLFIQQLENERLSILSRMNNDRNKLISIRQKRPREKRGSSRLRRETSEPLPSSSQISSRVSIQNRTFVKPRGSPPRQAAKANVPNVSNLKLTPEKKLSALTINENNQSFVSNPSPQMKRMRSESPAIKQNSLFNYNIRDDDGANNEDNLVSSIFSLKNELLDKELKLHDARQSINFDKNMRGMKEIFRSSLVTDIDDDGSIYNYKEYHLIKNAKSRKSSSSNDYSDDFENEDGHGDDDNDMSHHTKVKHVGNTISDLEYDSDDEVNNNIKNQVSQLGKSVFQMTVDDDDSDRDDNNIQSSGKFLMSGSSTLIHQNANPDNVLDTSVDRDLFHSLSSDAIGDGSDGEGKMYSNAEDTGNDDTRDMQSSLANLKIKQRKRQQGSNSNTNFPPPSPKARGNGINALRRLKQRREKKNNRYNRK
jgi:serine/threonine protein kinase